MENRWIKGTVGLLALLVLITSLIWCYHRIRKEQYKVPVIKFLNTEQAKDFLMGDYDGYLGKLTPMNVYALGVDGKDTLREKWVTSVDAFSKEEKEKLSIAIELAENAIRTIHDEKFRKQLQSIDWQFAKTIHPYYLDGYAHTRADMIWLTDKLIAIYSIPRLARLLVHEKTHLWQRKHPKAMRAWNRDQGFTPIGKLSDVHMSRQNPDLDDYLYADKQGRKMMVIFNKEFPRDLSDVTFTLGVKMEHPNEALAYQLEKIVEV
jgi:hypothetical protein